MLAVQALADQGNDRSCATSHILTVEVMQCALLVHNAYAAHASCISWQP